MFDENKRDLLEVVWSESLIYTDFWIAQSFGVVFKSLFLSLHSVESE